MSSRALFAMLLIVGAGPLCAQDWEGFASRSDRSMDSLVLQDLDAADLDTGIAICKGLGRRADSNVQAEIDFLLSQRNPTRRPESVEAMLRWLIASAVEAHPQPADLTAWVAANGPQVDRLLERMPRWADAQLKGSLLTLAVIAPGTTGKTAVMTAAVQLVGELRALDGGVMPPQETALCMDLLRAIRTLRDPGFLDACVQIARLSRDKDVVDAARAAARELAAAP